MSETLERIAELAAEGLEAVDAAPTSDALEEARIRFLGRKAELPNLLRTVAELPADERAATGKAANQARQALERALERRHGELAASELGRRLEQDRVDVTLPADPLPNLGGLHLLTQTRREIEEIFIGLGFDVAEGPEVETVYYNFDALNRPVTHPARARTDTFYVTDDVLLRTHPAPSRSARWRSTRRRSTSWFPDACTAPTPTRRTHRSSPRSRGSRSTPT